MIGEAHEQNGTPPPTCASCPYHVARKSPQAIGQIVMTCHRFPPQPVTVPIQGGVQVQFQFPVVSHRNVCFEHPSLRHITREAVVTDA